MRIFFLVTLSVLSYYNITAQTLFEKKLNEYKQELKEQSLKQLTKDSIENGESSMETLHLINSNPDTVQIKRHPTEDEIVVAPLYLYRLYSYELNNLNSTNFFSLPSYPAFNLYPVKNKVYVMPYYRIDNDTINSTIQDDEESNEQDPYIAMVKLSEKFSSSFFFVRLLDDQSLGNYPLAFIQNNKVKLIDRDLNIYDDIETYLLKEYGSVKKYTELCERDSIRHTFRINQLTVSDCKNILRSDYKNWESHYPNDTVTILNLFLKEIDSLAELTIEQSNLLKNKIIKDNYNYPICVSCDYCVELFHNDITYLVTSVLTNEQYYEYTEGRRLLTWRNSQVNLIIDHYYIIERKIPISQEDELINKEIFYHRH